MTKEEEQRILGEYAAKALRDQEAKKAKEKAEFDSDALYSTTAGQLGFEGSPSYFRGMSPEQIKRHFTEQNVDENRAAGIAQEIYNWNNQEYYVDEYGTVLAGKEASEDIRKGILSGEFSDTYILAENGDIIEKTFWGPKTVLNHKGEPANINDETLILQSTLQSLPGQKESVGFEKSSTDLTNLIYDTRDRWNQGASFQDLQYDQYGFPKSGMDYVAQNPMQKTFNAEMAARTRQNIAAQDMMRAQQGAGPSAASVASRIGQQQALRQGLEATAGAGMGGIVGGARQIGRGVAQAASTGAMGRAGETARFGEQAVALNRDVIVKDLMSRGISFQDALNLANSKLMQKQLQEAWNVGTANRDMGISQAMQNEYDRLYSGELKNIVGQYADEQKRQQGIDDAYNRGVGGIIKGASTAGTVISDAFKDNEKGKQNNDVWIDKNDPGWKEVKNP